MSLIVALAALLLATSTLHGLGTGAVQQVITLDQLIVTNNRLLAEQHYLFTAGNGDIDQIRDTRDSLDKLWKMRAERARDARRLGSGRALPPPPPYTLLGIRTP
jgi:hypothetical protein